MSRAVERIRERQAEQAKREAEAVKREVEDAAKGFTILALLALAASQPRRKKWWQF